MDADKIELEQSVALTPDRIIVSKLELIDEDLASYLAEFPEEMRVDVLRRALKIGLLALKGSTAIEKVDYVEKEFGKLSNRLSGRVDKFVSDIEEQLDKVFGDDRGIMRNALDKYLGAGGRLEDLFDPDRKDSAVSKISSIFDQYFKGRDSILYTWLDHSNPESPIAQLKKDLVENYLKEIRDHLIGEEMAEAEREKGTAKGRKYQEIVFEKVNEICYPFGDTPSYMAEIVGKLPRSKVGDIVIDVSPNYTGGPALKLVVEVKNEHGYTVDKIINELDVAKENRNATAALAVFTPDTCPSTCHPLQQYGDDKVICSYDPREPSDLSLELAYRVSRIEALRKLRGPSPEIDVAKLHMLTTQCLEKLKSISSIKGKVTRWSNDVNADLDSFYTELADLLGELDAVTIQAAAPQHKYLDDVRDEGET